MSSELERLLTEDRAAFPQPENFEPWWLTAAWARPLPEAQWSFTRLWSLRRSPSKRVSGWAKQRIFGLVPPFGPEVLLEGLGDPDEELSAWAALQLGVAGSRDAGIAAWAGDAVYLKLHQSTGLQAGACAQALAWMDHEAALEPLLRWADRGRDRAAQPGLHQALGRLNGCAPALAQLVDRASELPQFLGLSSALLEHRRPEDLDRIAFNAERLGMQPLDPNLFLLYSTATGGRLLSLELSLRLGRDWTTLDVEALGALESFAAFAQADRLPVREFAAQVQADKPEAALELLHETLGDSDHRPSAADLCGLELLDRTRRLFAEYPDAGGNRAAPILAVGMMAVLAGLQRRTVEQALQSGTQPEDLLHAFASASADFPSELVLRAIEIPDFGERLAERLAQGATYSATRWMAVVAARQQTASAAPPLLKFLDDAGGLLGLHRTVLDALRLLGPAILEAARSGYLLAQIRTPGLTALAATLSDAEAAEPFLGEMRDLYDLDVRLYAALASQLGSRSALERLDRELETSNATALFPAIELLTQLHQTPEETLERARRWAGSGKSASIPKPGRNDPCPCGSGKKYKNCCLA